MRGLVEGEIRATEAELAWLDEREREATATEAAGITVERERARARLEALLAVTSRAVK